MNHNARKVESWSYEFLGVAENIFTLFENSKQVQKCNKLYIHLSVRTDGLEKLALIPEGVRYCQYSTASRINLLFFLFLGFFLL